MAPIVLLGLVLLGAVGFAAHVASAGIRAIPLEGASLRGAGAALAVALAGERSFALEPLREAARAPRGRTREAWLAEADGALVHLLRVPSGELRACAKIANAASFAAAAWALRAGLTDEGGPRFDLEGALGQSLACVVLGFVATGVVAGVHRAVVGVLRDERAAFAALLERLEAEESSPGGAESRA
jgi:hypothetical protein